MAVYNKIYSSIGGNQYKSELVLSEQSLYGSSRLGLFKPKTGLVASHDFTTSFTGVKFDDIKPGITKNEALPSIEMSTYRGQKSYELSNHLGNVLAVVSDRVNSKTIDGVTVDGFEADIQSANYYYPFGMQMPDRNMSSDEYRYGFNGKEKDDDLAGGKQGMSYDFGARLYNPGLGR